MGSSSTTAPWAAALPAPVKKTHRALMPLFVSLVVVTYLDRTSLAFAALQLCRTDWFNAKVYGLVSEKRSLRCIYKLHDHHMTAARMTAAKSPAIDFSAQGGLHAEQQPGACACHTGCFRTSSKLAP
jgi:hypothetical protein